MARRRSRPLRRPAGPGNPPPPVAARPCTSPSGHVGESGPQARTPETSPQGPPNTPAPTRFRHQHPNTEAPDVPQEAPRRNPRAQRGVLDLLQRRRRQSARVGDRRREGRRQPGPAPSNGQRREDTPDEGPRAGEAARHGHRGRCRRRVDRGDMAGLLVPEHRQAHGSRLIGQGLPDGGVSPSHSLVRESTGSRKSGPSTSKSCIRRLSRAERSPRPRTRCTVRRRPR